MTYRKNVATRLAVTAATARSCSMHVQRYERERTTRHYFAIPLFVVWERLALGPALRVLAAAQHTFIVLAAAVLDERAHTALAVAVTGTVAPVGNTAPPSAQHSCTSEQTEFSVSGLRLHPDK